MDLDELYQEIILDHYKNPRCRGCLENATSSSRLFNPLCGDRVELSVLINGDVVEDLAFQGRGCSISQASTSLMCGLCRGKKIDEVRGLFRTFQGMLKRDRSEEELEVLEDAQALKGVSRFPARYRCALLGWEALEKCIEESAAAES